MSNLELFASIMFVVQLVHSAEELKTGFHKKWFLFKMKYRTFLIFEILHNSFWLLVLLFKNFPYREQLLLFFIFLMLANGIEHVVWGFVQRKYVPGLITAPLHILIFVIFYFSFF